MTFICFHLRIIDTLRNVSSSAFICSSMSLIVHVRDTICLLVFSVFSIIFWLFCFSSSLSAVILASFSFTRISWSSSNCLLIFSSVSWVSFWKLTERYEGRTRSILILESPKSHHLFQTLIWSAVWSKVSLKFSNDPSFSCKCFSESLSFSWKRTTKLVSVLLSDFIFSLVFEHHWGNMFGGRGQNELKPVTPVQCLIDWCNFKPVAAMI